MTKYLIFVYGTLKRGYERSEALADQEFVAVATTMSHYRMYNLGTYPGLVFEGEHLGDAIEGELYQVDESCKSRLDEIEGVDEGLYELREIELSRPAELSHALAYFYRGSIEGRINCGNRW